MRIYNYLFYKTYLLAIRSKNFDDVPVLGGIVFVGFCLMFNIFSIAFIFEEMGIIDEMSIKKEYEFVFALGLVLLLYFYYSYKGRYKRIINYYEQKPLGIVQLHPIIVILVYYLVSFGLLILAGLYKNHDWIFAQ